MYLMYSNQGKENYRLPFHLKLLVQVAPVIDGNDLNNFLVFYHQMDSSLIFKSMKKMKGKNVFRIKEFDENNRNRKLIIKKN